MGYNGTTADGHYVSCPYGCFAFFQNHNNTYISQGVSGHRANCSDCSYSSIENHTWITYGSGYKCRRCNYTTSIIPTPAALSLPDEELEIYLSTLTDSELEALLASLPEADLARVTAILPPDDDEHLTE